MVPVARRIILSAWVMLGCCTATAGGGERHPGSFALRGESNGWTATYLRSPQPATSVVINGTAHTLFESPPAASPADSGFPLLPVELLSLGIPFDAEIAVELKDPVYEVEGNQLVAPVPGYRGTDEGEAIAVYRKDPAAYAADRFFPGRELWADRATTLRSQRIASIHLAPLQYNPATRVLRRLVSGTLAITLRPGTPPGLPVARASPTRDPSFEDVYRSLIANYDEAKQWRGAPLRPGGSAADPARDWFTTGKTYYRVPVATDGWYRVTKNDLASAGANPNALDTASLAMFFRGNQIPVHVRPDSSVEFFGVKNTGDSTVLDFYTDTSAYWMTWGGAQGRRFVPTAQPAGVPLSDLISATVTVHREENTDYYDGTGAEEITDPGTVPGEGWAWEYYYPGSSFSHAFVIDSLDPAVPAAAVRVRLFSTTPNFATPNHRARFWMNDSLLGELTFDGRKEGRFSAAFPSRWLMQGSNVIRILSDPPPGSPVNQFYLDWFEVDYPRLNRAVGDRCFVTTPASSGGSPVRCTVAGFSSPAIDIFDCTTGRRILGGLVTGDPGGGYAISFQDTFSTSRRYAVIGANGSRNVGAVASKVFSDIRANAAGADYIIITHRDFMSSAQRLAAHRRAANGVRAAVIDVQDIYDEFNYGVMNAEKIRTFLRHAYTSWPGPPPTYLLLFGDASWDYHRFMPTTIKKNYVPAYGIPSSDNWFACFDSVTTFIPSLLIGRLPVQDPIQADRLVTKLIGYETPQPAEWVKKFLFISGGTTASEKLSFNAMSDASINQYILPDPVGGSAYRVYKTTPDAIDGENKQLLKDIVKTGVVFVNFLGHSGGRVWGVDIGNPNDLENTNGRLPFVSSVSCNVGAFAEPSSNVLSEDFVLAENRGAIAMWASSSLGYANVGSALVNNFLQGVQRDSVRGFGALTTAARYRYWQMSGSSYITIASVQLNPLIGDPLSQLLLPVKPDLAVSTADITLDTAVPSPIDTAATLNVILHNYGLVPADSVTVVLTDLYNGRTTPVLDNVRIPPTRFRDSLAVRWRGTSQIGRHTFQMTIDPGGAVQEVTRANNAASADSYVYANLLSILRPLRDMVVSPGPQILRVSSPFGVDSASLRVAFELDTVPSFNSPALVASGPVVPGPVSTEWTTGSLTEGGTYFWRARTTIGSVVGAWITTSFTVSSVLPPVPLVRWRESTRKQFARDLLRQASVTDSGVTIAPNAPVRVFARSLGYRADANRDYYSVLGVNEQTMAGLWWVHGSGFLGVRLDDFTGAASFQGFDTPAQPAQAESLANFINVTPAGNYIALSVVFDGRSNVTASLRNAIRSLGSTLIDSLQAGHAWCLIARKGASGPGITPLERWSANGAAAESLQVPNYYSSGSGSITSAVLPMPQRWESFRWSNSGVPGVTGQRVAILGMRSDGAIDTLRIIPADSATANLAALNVVTGNPSYINVRFSGLLTSTDALITPVLREWSADFEPPADLAVSQRTLSSPKIALRKGEGGSVTLGVYNVGYRKADSARVILSVVEQNNALRPVAYAMVDSLPAGGLQTLRIPFETQGLPQQFTIQARVVPPANAKDLIQENNSTLYSFLVTGADEKLAARVQVFSDGVQLMDGDYVAARPRIAVRLVGLTSPVPTPPRVDLFVDRTSSSPSSPGTLENTDGAIRSEGDDLIFSPVLSTGTHEFLIRVSQPNRLGGVDSVLHRVAVSVIDDYKILQMYNYPNPFRSDTWFTFVLTGARPPEELTLGIFTVAGRRIRELRLLPGSLQVGFNRLYWDGRDAEGDEVANGYYLYKVQMTGGGKTQTALGKIARVR